MTYTLPTPEQLAEMLKEEWQDIATAPKDGTYIFLSAEHGYYDFKAWSKVRKAWVDYPDGDIDYGNLNPGYKEWMPLTSGNLPTFTRELLKQFEAVCEALEPQEFPEVYMKYNLTQKLEALKADLPVVRLDKYYPKLPDESLVEIFLSKDAVENMKVVPGGFIVKIIALNRPDADATELQAENKQLTAKLEAQGGQSVILQERVTLDEAVLAIENFPNGCAFRLVIDQGKPFLEYGCYGVHINLAQGKEWLLMNWLGREITEPKALPVRPETMHEMLRREPCKVCGGTRIKPIQLNESGVSHE